MINTYKIPSEENIIPEVKYVKWMNKVIYKYIDMEESIESQTIANMVRLLYEQSRWKFWYSKIDNQVIIQIHDYWKDGRMLRRWFDRLNRELWIEQEEDMERELDWVFDEYIKQIWKYEVF
jgi:hypothetical protein